MLGRPSEFHVGGMTILLITTWGVALVPVWLVLLYGLLCTLVVRSRLAGVNKGCSM
jgi:hypothetical protein